MSLRLITPPAVEPVTLLEAKLHLRVDLNEDDELITALIRAAREHAEMITRRALITQTWELGLDQWPAGREITIPLPPLQSVDSITYTDAAGSEHALGLDTCTVDGISEPGRVVLNVGCCWPTDTLQAADAIHITFRAGYEDTDKVPQAIKQAILLMVGWWYEQREVATVGAVAREVPLAAEALLWPYRVLRWL